MGYSRLTVVLTESEMEQLRQSARQNVRRPRDQARYILLSSLGMTDPASNAMSADTASTSQLPTMPTGEVAPAHI
jgi:hypothetical protein